MNNNNNKQFGTKKYMPRMAAKLIKIIVRAFNLSQDFTVQQRKNEFQGDVGGVWSSRISQNF